MDGKGEIRVFILGAEHMNSGLIFRPKLIHFMETGNEYSSLSNHGNCQEHFNRNALRLRVQLTNLIKYKVFYLV